MIKNFIGNVIGMIGGAGAMVLFTLLPVGALYWIWIAIKLGSFVMFVLGVLGPAVLITAPIGLYMFLFGVPHWVVSLFG